MGISYGTFALRERLTCCSTLVNVSRMPPSTCLSCRRSLILSRGATNDFAIIPETPPAPRRDNCLRVLDFFSRIVSKSCVGGVGRGRSEVWMMDSSYFSLFSRRSPSLVYHIGFYSSVLPVFPILSLSRSISESLFALHKPKIDFRFQIGFAIC